MMLNDYVGTGQGFPTLY